MQRVENSLSAKNTEEQLFAILDKVLETKDIEVPQELVDEEFNMIVIEFNHRVKYDSMATGKIFELTQDEIKNRTQQFKEEAFKRVKIRLMLKEIIESENIIVTKKELEEEAKALSVRQQIPIDMVKDFLGEDLDLLKNDLLIKKAIDIVSANTTIIKDDAVAYVSKLTHRY